MPASLPGMRPTGCSCDPSGRRPPRAGSRLRRPANGRDSGDLMLDADPVGETRRISPEAPVPVVEVSERSERPGGAANTALNLAALGASPTVVGVLGDDAEGERLRALLGQAGIATEFIIRDRTRPTTSKTRIIARGQQIVRIDSEVRAPLAPPQELALMGALREALSQADGCVLSDYHKGVLTPRVSAEAVSLARRLDSSGGGRSQGDRFFALPRLHGGDPQRARVGSGRRPERGHESRCSPGGAAAGRAARRGRAGDPRRCGHDPGPRPISATTHLDGRAAGV